MTPPLTFLQWYNNEEEKFLGHTVTSDEAWISYSNAVTQKHSLVWKHNVSPQPMKHKQTFRGKKLMAGIFGDRKGVLLLQLINPGARITSQVCCETINYYEGR
jgi:hypothetical protein